MYPTYREKAGVWGADILPDAQFKPRDNAFSLNLTTNKLPNSESCGAYSRTTGNNFLSLALLSAPPLFLPFGLINNLCARCSLDKLRLDVLKSEYSGEERAPSKSPTRN